MTNEEIAAVLRLRRALHRLVSAGDFNTVEEIERDLTKPLFYSVRDMDWIRAMRAILGTSIYRPTDPEQS
jgi:hypothetical protein